MQVIKQDQVQENIIIIRDQRVIVDAVPIAVGTRTNMKGMLFFSIAFLL